MHIIRDKQLLLTTISVMVAPHSQVYGEIREVPLVLLSPTMIEEINRAWDAIDTYTSAARKLLRSRRS